MRVEDLAAWLLEIMVATVPPGAPTFPAEAQESAEAASARYEHIAHSIADAALSSEEASLFDGDNGRAKTAALMLAISYHESSWRRDVDYGLVNLLRHGRYHCLFQIGVRNKTMEGWTADDLIYDRTKCARAALHILQRGQRFCGRGEDFDWVNHYASGTCDRGREAVSKRIDTFDRWLREYGVGPTATPTSKTD